MEREWRIREGTPADADACARLAVEAWRRIHGGYEALLGAELHDRLMPDWRAAKAADVAQALRERPGDTLVATAAGETIGFVTFRIDTGRGIGDIGNNAVAPEWQGRGIASALYRATLRRMREAGVTVARVTTGLDDGHAPARAAYHKVGFRLGLPSITYIQDLSADDGPT